MEQEGKQNPEKKNTPRASLLLYFSLPPTVMPGSRMETDRPATSLCRVN